MGGVLASILSFFFVSINLRTMTLILHKTTFLFFNGNILCFSRVVEET